MRNKFRGTLFGQPRAEAEQVDNAGNYQPNTDTSQEGHQQHLYLNLFLACQRG